MVSNFEYHPIPYIFEVLEKDFIATFSKIGLKFDALFQIHGLKQASDKIVRDYASRLRQYLSRCLEKETPSQEQLVSYFLEGL